MIKGIDLSAWNGDVDWELVAKDVDFVILRAGYGKMISQKDSRFESYYSGCKKYGIKVGVYWYSYARTVDEAKMEAKVCLSVLNNRKIDLPVWYDIEEDVTFATGKENVSNIADAFFKTIIEAGYGGGIYSSLFTFQNYFTKEVKEKYDIWLAHVASDGGALSQTSYPDKKDLWQYSWKGKVNGISGDVDLDYCYKDYFTSKNNENDKNNTQTVYYQSYTDRWLGKISDCNDIDCNGFSGVKGDKIHGVTIYSNECRLKYRVHIRNEHWLDWISDSDINDWENGVAGIKNKDIDGLQIGIIDKQGYDVCYRVSTVERTQYLPWVTNWNDMENGYAGVFDESIDRIQIKIVAQSGRDV